MEKFDKDLEEIKSKFNNVKLRDESKNNLKIKMEEELNRPDIKENIKTIIFPRKLVATFACFFLLITSCVAFADEIESFVTNIFSNTDRKIEDAIANGNYKEIDMEYVEHDGIGIKVDYIVQEEDSLCIAFNVKSEEEFDNIYFNEIEIKNQENNSLYTSIKKCEDVFLTKYKRKLNNRNSLIIYEFKYIKENIDENTELLFNIDKISCLKEKINVEKEGEWNFNIEI